MAPYPSSSFPIRSVPDYYIDTLINPCLVNNFCLVLTSHFTDKNQTFFFIFQEKLLEERQAKEREKANIKYSLFTHASYCSSETTAMTAECNGSEEFGDDVDVVQTSDTG